MCGCEFGDGDDDATVAWRLMRCSSGLTNKLVGCSLDHDKTLGTEAAEEKETRVREIDARKDSVNALKILKQFSCKV